MVSPSSIPAMIQVLNSPASAENAGKTAIGRAISDRILPASHCYFSKSSANSMRGQTAELIGKTGEPNPLITGISAETESGDGRW
jgi:hypothetical protein